MELYIETLTGTAFELRVSPFETILSVKAKIQRLEGIPISQQHLIWKSKELEDDTCLQDHHIQDGATLKLVLAMRGGPINTKRITVDDSSLADYLEAGELFLEKSADRQITLVVVREGDQYNFYRVVDRDDGTYSPLSGSASATSSANGNDDDEEAAAISRKEAIEKLQENESTRQKLEKLRSQMEKMALSKKPKKKPHPPVGGRPMSKGRLRHHASVTHSLLARPTLARLQAPVPAATSHGQEEVPVKYDLLTASHRLVADHDYLYSSHSKGALALKPPTGASHQLASVPVAAAASSSSAAAAVPKVFAESDSLRCGTHRKIDFLTISEGPPEQETIEMIDCRKLVTRAPDNLYDGVGRSRTVFRALTRSGQRVSSRQGSASGYEAAAAETVTLPTAKSRADAPSLTVQTGRDLLTLQDEWETTHDGRLMTSRLTRLTTSQSRQSSTIKLPPVRKKAANRCFRCSKKTGLASSYLCRCGNNFCATHRYSEVHNCPFDYKTEGRKLLEQNNPVISAPKLPKI